MKKIKKLLAMIMAMTMVLGMAMTVSAAESTSALVTVDVGEAEDVDDFALYYDQIVVADTTSVDGWKYVDAYANYFADISIEDLVSIVTNSQSGSAENGTLTTSAALAKALEDSKSTVQTRGTAITNKLSFNAEAGGLYVIIPQATGDTYSPTLVYVPVNHTDPITVKAKGAADQVVKKVDAGGESVAPGDIVKYTVEVAYPYISANHTNPSFKITDTLTNGTVIDEDPSRPITVTNAGIVGTGYSIEVSPDKATITIDVKYAPENVGKTISIEYYVRVSESVTSDNPLKNKVSSELTIEPGETTKTEYVVISNPVKVEFNKVSEDNNETLQGAVFAVYKGLTSDGTENDTLVSIFADAASVEGITLPGEYKDKAALLKADGAADGKLVVTGLDGQEKYYVVEIIAPDGYKVDNTPHALIGGGADTPAYSTDSETDPETGVTTITTEYFFKDFQVNGDKITNTKLSSLPSTGGIGTTIFTIGGCAIMIAAAALYFVNRRKSEEN